MADDEIPNAFLGEVRLFPFDALPPYWVPCDGRVLPVAGNDAMFAILFNAYGGDGKTTFALPDLRGRIPVQQHGATGALGSAGSGSGASQSYQAFVYAIAVGGTFPVHGSSR